MAEPSLQDFLTRIGYPNLLPLLQAGQIETVNALMQFEEEDFQDLGIQGSAKRAILKEIESFKKNPVQQQAAPVPMDLVAYKASDLALIEMKSQAQQEKLQHQREMDRVQHESQFALFKLETT